MLTWTKPLLDAEGITSFWILCHSPVDALYEWKEIMRCDGDSLTVEITGLQQRTTYTFKVVYGNVAGRYAVESDSSDPVQTI